MAVIKFGTSGWREIIARDFTFDNVRLATQGIADYLNSEISKSEVGNPRPQARGHSRPRHPVSGPSFFPRCRRSSCRQRHRAASLRPRHAHACHRLRHPPSQGHRRHQHDRQPQPGGISRAEIFHEQRRARHARRDETNRGEHRQIAGGELLVQRRGHRHLLLQDLQSAAGLFQATAPAH